jgi:hypothetical protein
MTRGARRGAPQVVGAVGFIVASGMLTLETQRDWWRPEPLDIGWHVAFWNLVVRAAPAHGPRGGRPLCQSARRAFARALLRVAVSRLDCRARADKHRHNIPILESDYPNLNQFTAAACAARRARSASGSAPSSGTLVRSTCAGASASPPSGVRAPGPLPCHAHAYPNQVLTPMTRAWHGRPVRRAGA